MGSKKFSWSIDIINYTTISNTGPDGNCLSPEQQERGGFAEMLQDSQRLGQWQGVVGPLTGVEGCPDLPVTKEPESTF